MKFFLHTLLLLSIAVLGSGVGALAVRSHHGPESLPSGAVMVDKNRYFYPISVETTEKSGSTLLAVTIRVGSDFNMGTVNVRPDWNIGSRGSYYFYLRIGTAIVRARVQASIKEFLPTGTSANVRVLFNVRHSHNLSEASLHLGRNPKVMSEGYPLERFFKK